MKKKTCKSVGSIFMAICMAITMSSTSLFAVVADAIEESQIEQQVQDSEEISQQASEEVKQESNQEDTEESTQDNNQQKSTSVAKEADQQDSEDSSNDEKVEDQITIKVPKGATLFVGTKTAHYVAFTEVKPDRDPTTEDGVTTYAFNDLSSSQVYNLRVSMEGKVTYCDYFKPDKGTVFTFRTTEDSENPDSDTIVTLKDDSSQVLRDSVNSNGADIYTNIGSTGQKNLAVGEQFKLRNYRVWQNITDGINNYFFEPDFHYEIISGSDVISYDQETSKITALKEGTAIVKITYDAQEITSVGYTQVKTTLATPTQRKLTSSIWPENVGLFVVKVESDGEVNTGINWDAEHDSYYYVNSFNGEKTGETNAKYTFEPEEGSTVTVLRPALNDAKTSVSYKDTFSSEGVSTKDGKVTVTLNHGRNIIKVEKDGKASYQVITARPLDLTMQDEDGNQIDTAKPGQKVNIIYNGISTPVYKMSGIYNPNTNYIEYSNGVTGDNAGQYLTGKMNLNVTIPSGVEDDSYTISGTGKICVTLWGDKIGEGHRENIGDEGRQPNLSAGTDSGKFSVLPEITIPVDIDTIERQVVTFNNFPENGYVVISNSDSSIKYTKNIIKLPVGEYSYTVGANGYKPQRGTFTVTDESVNITLNDMEAVDSSSAGTAWDGIELSEPDKKDGVYQIKTGAELAWFANNVSKGEQNAKALLLNDIDLAGYDWTPIGEFYGSFDGGNHIIKNLYVKNANYSSALFSCLGTDGIIKNLTVDGNVIIDTVNGSNLYKNINTKKLFYVSGIVAEAKYSTIENCHNNVDVTVSGEIPGGLVYQKTTFGIGGVVGKAYNEVVKNCTNTGDINVTSTTTQINTNSGIGGLIGYSTCACTIKNCGNEGNVTSLALVNQKPFSIPVGGLIGFYSFSYDIENCYNKGTVKSNSTYGIGGISGLVRGGKVSWADKNGIYVSETFETKVNNCYNVGNIIGTNASASEIGGIVGNANTILGIKNTYTTGKIETASTNTNKVGISIGKVSYSNTSLIASNSTSNYYKPQDNLNFIGSGDNTNVSRTEIVDESTVQALIEVDKSAYCGYDEIYPILYWELSNITEIKVVKQPDKLNYYLNTSLDTDGMMLSAKDSSGKVYNVNGYFASASPDKFETTGKQTITISFGGAKTEIDVNVYEEGKKAEFIKLPEVDENTTNIITIQNNTGINNLVFEADGKGEVEYKIYRANDINSAFTSGISFIKDKRKLLLSIDSTSKNSYLYKVEATIGEEVIETQVYLIQVVDRNTECIINYEQPENGKFELTDIAGNTIESGSKIPSGKKVLPKFTPNEGYAISKYQANGRDLDYKSSTYVSEDTSFLVEYGKECTVTFEKTSKDENNVTKGTVSVKHGVNTITSGDKVGEGAILTISTSSNGSGNTWYIVDSIDVTAKYDESIKSTYTKKQDKYTVLDTDVNIEAKYSLGAKIFISGASSVTYDYSYDDVTEADKSSATIYLPAGKEVKVTPKCNANNYKLTGMNFTAAGVDSSAKCEIGDDYSCIFTTIAGNNYTLSATSQRLYNPNIRIVGEGSIQILNESGEEITQNDYFMLGSTIIVNATPKDGYKLTSLKNGSTEITSGIAFVSNSNSFRATFEKDETKWSKVTFDSDNGQDSVVKEIKKDEALDYTPEIPVKEGYTFVGWYKDIDDITTEYKNNQSYTEDTIYKAKWAHVEMLGAQVKLVVDGKSGIRFGTKLYNDGDEIVEKGTLIIPASLLAEGEALTLDTPKVARSIGKVNYEVNEEENYVTYLGTLVNIPQAQFEREMTAASYVIYKDKAGNKYTVYSQYPNGSTSVYKLLENNVDWDDEW